MEKRYEETTYVICHNGSDIIHPVQVEPGTLLSTGQPEVEEFADKGAWEARLSELGFDTAKLAPLSLNGPETLGVNKISKSGGPLLTAEERKTLSPEERRALRAERRAARLTA